MSLNWFTFILQAGSESLKITNAKEKGLTLEDTQGMFLLLGAGFLMGASALVSEWMGGITRRCRIGKKKPSSANSKQELISTPEIENEVKVITDATESRINFDNRSCSSSAGSRDTLESQVINVTEESIEVHEGLDAARWDSRRSSSVDLDREVQEIFEKDLRRRKIVTDDIDEVIDEKREPTASHGAFGDRLK